MIKGLYSRSKERERGLLVIRNILCFFPPLYLDYLDPGCEILGRVEHSPSLLAAHRTPRSLSVVLERTRLAEIVLAPVVC